ncbi:S41 family peptidase [Microbacterium sp. NPDC056052]|uniref:S41 family peptidase n=1 Tax=Microbacterium sp. NPDC056052 TaxID=3345695 RepID=UPI0035E05455
MNPRAAHPLQRCVVSVFSGLVLVGLLAASGCSAPVAPTATVSPSSSSLDGYVDSALAVMDERGLYRDSDQWRDELARARDRAGDIDSPSAAYALLREAVRKAGGVHSFFLTPGESAPAPASEEPIAVPNVETQDGISVLHLPALAAPNGSDDAESYLRAGRTAITANAAATTCGWVLDLSDNSGGNGLTMLDVIGPLLDTDQAIGLRYPDGREEWLSPQGDDAPHGLGPVAIVTSGVTRSAAEMVLAAFDRQADTVRVGQPSAGMTTSNQVFPLEDGAEIVLTTAWFMNRNGEKLDGPMEPGVGVPRGEGTQAAKLAAQGWVRSTCLGK